MDNTPYIKSIELLLKCSTTHGFIASANNISNYNRVWARDGVICGLAAISSGNFQLIDIYQKTLETLAINQHENGTIPSNVLISDNNLEVSYGGLAGRVDAVSWFIIGVCQLAFYKNDLSIIEKYQKNIQKCIQLMEAWEFNNKHLMYVPLSGNWADEYITDGYTLYDQLLRLWALKSYNHFEKNNSFDLKIQNITNQIVINFTPNSIGEKFHEKAYNELVFKDFMPCSFSPSGYKLQFDAFANALAVLLNIGTKDFQDRILDYFIKFQKNTVLNLIPAFWPPIIEHDEDWKLLKSNCKYEFRNYPNEFHNGGSWAMVNGFIGLALLSKNKIEEAQNLLQAIDFANATENYSFYENFNTKTAKPNGVPNCAWSAAATIFLNQNMNSNFKFLI